MTLSEAFAHFIQHPVPLGEEEVYLCTRSILDTVGAMVLGSRTGVVEKAARVIPRAGKATLAGIGGGFSARDAAFLNGISGHELELDDTSSSNLGHPHRGCAARSAGAGGRIEQPWRRTDTCIRRSHRGGVQAGASLRSRPPRAGMACQQCYRYCWSRRGRRVSFEIEGKGTRKLPGNCRLHGGWCAGELRDGHQVASYRQGGCGWTSGGLSGPGRLYRLLLRPGRPGGLPLRVFRASL